MVSPPNTPQHNYSLIRGITDFTLGCIGTGTGLALTLYFTTDIQTALGLANNWFLVTAPSSEASAQWSNPVSNIVGNNVCHFKANAIALRAVSGPVDGGVTPVTGSISLQMMAGF